MQDYLAHATPLEMVRACDWSTEDLRDLNDHSGPDKRIEFNYPHNDSPSLFDPDGWKDTIEKSPALTHEHLQESVEHDSLSLISPEMILIVTPEKMVLTAASTVSLHLAAQPLLQHLRRCGAIVHWASYLRLNTTSPWLDSADTGMAMEYSVLKEIFPSGRPALLGPLSSDYYFYFVFDAIPRHEPNSTVEEDVQVNAVLHDVCIPDAALPLESSVAEVMRVLGDPVCFNTCLDRTASNYFSCTIGAGGLYKYVKLTETNGGLAVSFETNSNDAKQYLKLISDLVAVFRPERISLLFLFDPASRPVQDGGAKASASFHPPAYGLLNKATAEFEFGYLVHKLNFSRVTAAI